MAEKDAIAFGELLSAMAVAIADPLDPAPMSRDPGDDYLVALARASNSLFVTGDDDLLALAPGLPVVSPASFPDRLALGQAND